MKIPQNHNTSIDDLLQKGSTSIFLSGWSKQDEAYGVKRSLLSNALSESENNADEYLFIDEMQEVKTWLSDVITETTTYKVDPANFAISSNGTATIFLILYNLHKHNKLKALLLTPIYFSYIKLLNDFSVDIEFLQIVHNGSIVINYDELTKIIKANGINLIILNDPLFGAGIPFGIKNYNKIVEICNEYNVKLLVDYIYGGMEWGHSPSIINRYLINLTINKKVILIDSISKRIFLNGIKTSLVFAHSSIIKEFELSSVHTIGTLTSPQISILKQLYTPSNRNSVLNTIGNTIRIARENYSLLKTLLMGTRLYLSNCDSGYFCLIYIPYCILNYNVDNFLLAEHIIENLDILTIPHDRYLHFCNSAYCFRINLTIPTNTLIISISNLLSFFNIHNALK